MCWLAVTSSSLQRFEEVSGDVERLVEDREQAVALALEDLEPGVRHELHRSFQQVDARERIAVAAHEEGRTADQRQVLCTELVGEAGTMQWIREEDQAAELRFDRGHARDTPAERLAASDHIVPAA